MPDKKTVLIISDEMGDLMIFAAIVERMCDAYAVKANSANEALAYLEMHQPDCIMLFPSMDGFEFLRILRGQPSWTQIPVLGLASYFGHRDRMRELGVNDVLTTPYHPRQVVAAVQALLGGSEL